VARNGGGTAAGADSGLKLAVVVLSSVDVRFQGCWEGRGTSEYRGGRGRWVTGSAARQAGPNGRSYQGEMGLMKRSRGGKPAAGEGDSREEDHGE
jgi:hypothetical protein